MIAAGVAALGDKIGSPTDALEIPAWIENQLKAEPVVWTNFQAFPFFYKRLKIGWIVETGLTKSRMPEAQKRLNHLIKMTAKNKRYGSYPMEGLD